MGAEHEEKERQDGEYHEAPYRPEDFDNGAEHDEHNDKDDNEDHLTLSAHNIVEAFMCESDRAAAIKMDDHYLLIRLERKGRASWVDQLALARGKGHEAASDGSDHDGVGR